MTKHGRLTLEIVKKPDRFLSFCTLVITNKLFFFPIKHTIDGPISIDSLIIRSRNWMKMLLTRLPTFDCTRQFGLWQHQYGNSDKKPKRFLEIQMCIYYMVNEIALKRSICYFSQFYSENFSIEPILRPNDKRKSIFLSQKPTEFVNILPSLLQHGWYLIHW